MFAQNKDNRPLRVVVAMDKFRGSLSAVQAAEAVRDGLLQGVATAGERVEIRLFPMADGGEGSLDVVECAMKNIAGAADVRDRRGDDDESASSLLCGGSVERVEIDSVNHLGIAMKVPVLLFGENPRTAFIEMAAVCGLNLIPKEYRNIMRSTSFGLGDVMQKAIESYGARKLVVAIGGSGTSDGGFGMVSALGFRFINPTPMRNKDVPSFISGITEVDDRGIESICPHLHETSIQVACDVTNPLLGLKGAVAVYSSQKGCKPSDKPLIEAAMQNWAEVVGSWYIAKYPDKIQRAESVCRSAVALSDFPGSGAAGGVGFAMKYMLGADMRPGWELFSEMVDLEANIAQADLVITGEGSFDESSLFGKLPYGIAMMCRKYDKPLWVIAGRSKVEEAKWRALGIERVEELIAHATQEEDSIRDARAILSRICSNIQFY